MAFTLLSGTGFEPGSIDVVELYTGGTWTVRTASPAPRTGNYYLANSSSPSAIYAQFDVTGGSDDVYVAAANYPVTGSSYQRIRAMQSGVALCEVRWNGTTRCWDAYVNNVLVANGSIIVSVGKWHHIQVRFHIANAGASPGHIQTYIDGNLDINYAGDTMPGITDTLNKIHIGSGSGATYWDDIAVGTGGWPGDIRFDVKKPKADDSNSWELSAGADAYALVDEIPPSDADYIIMEKDFSVTITDNTESISDAFQSGEIYVANGNAVPDVGDRFLCLGTGDFTGDDLATAKGAPLAAGDIFEVTDNSVGTEAVEYIDRIAMFELDDWDATDKEPLGIIIWARANKSEAVNHTLNLLLDDGAVTTGSDLNILQATTYVKRILNVPPTAPEWNPVLINALLAGVRGNLV